MSEALDVLRAEYGSDRTRRFHFKQQVLDHGFVRYIDHMGGDEDVISAARMSTGKGFKGWGDAVRCTRCGRAGTGSSEPEDLSCTHDFKFGPGDEKLLEFLYCNKHFTPFEMCELVVEVKAPIFVFRELHRHRTFSINERSARYAQMPNEHYLPELERFKPKQTGNKQADSVRIGDWTDTNYESYREAVRGEQGDVYENYELALMHGVPKEVARVNTPVSRYSVMRWKANLRNWLQMFTLRDHAAAQWECQQTVKPIVEVARALFPRTIALWEEHTKYAVTFSRTEGRALREMLDPRNLSDDAVTKGIWKKVFA